PGWIAERLLGVGAVELQGAPGQAIEIRRMRRRAVAGQLGAEVIRHHKEHVDRWLRRAGGNAAGNEQEEYGEEEARGLHGDHSIYRHGQIAGLRSMEARLDDGEIVVEEIGTAQLANVAEQRIHGVFFACGEAGEVTDARAQVPDGALFPADFIDAVAEDKK